MQQLVYEGRAMADDESEKFKPRAVFPTPFPCRIDESSRTIHCDSCELIPELLEEIASLKQKLQERKGGS
jgi:hypothetical protein